MKTQISRDSFNGIKRYSGVYLQQGRMITDADWNETTEIARRRLDDALLDAIAAGVPRDTGVKLEAVAAQPLRIRRGRVYAGGVGALVTSTLADPAQPFGLNQQADLPLPDNVVPPAVSYRVYLDVWDRAVTSLEDAQLRDPAFHGADTASRTQTMAQLKWCGAALDPENPAVNPRMGDAALTLTLRSQLAGLDPCDPCAREITIPPRIGNYLFRLEVHAVEGGPKNPTRLVLKWSSENGAEAHAVGTEPADFKGNDWVYEYFTSRTEKHLGVHLAGGISPLVGQLLERFPDAPPDGFPFVRRWDGYCSLRRQGTQWSLEDGRERSVDLSTSSSADADGHAAFAGNALTIQLSTLTLELAISNQTSFVAGDYWLASLRESVHAPGDVVLSSAPPAGIRHSYLLLATIGNTGVKVVPDTNRQQQLDFPSLTTLAARDVDYTANCPSGLFDASIDTVQKALDRVCSINATQVGFAKPCDTSVYQGVDPATINTVAKALGLLCDVRAEQISYKNAPACSTLSGATTVQQALDLLCLHESSSGCRTTIGKGGDFPTIREAIDAFQQRGETAFCFCLLPGEHPIQEAIALKPTPGKSLHFSLEGCGPASVIRLAAPFSIAGFASASLDDVAMVISAEASLQWNGGEQVRIERCRIAIPDHGATPPITVGASHLVRIAGNDIEASRRRRLEVARDLVSDEPALTALFADDVAEGDVPVLAARAAEKIAGMPIAQRRKLGSSIGKAITDRDGDAVPARRRILTDEKTRFSRISELLPSTSPNLSETLASELVNLRAAVVTLEPTLALVLVAEGGNADISGNRIVGEVSIYGKPGEVALNVDQAAKLRRGLFEAVIQLQSRDDNLIVTGNQITRLRIDGDLMIRLRDAQDGTTIPGLFRTLRLTDNVLTHAGSDALALDATLSGNRISGADPRLATVVAYTAYYVGNHLALNQGFAVRNVAPRSNAQTRSDLNNGVIVDA